MLGKPKYKYKDRIRFKWKNITLVGKVEVVDSFGTCEQQKEASYDIYVEANNTLYKHIVESETIGIDNSDDLKIIKINDRQQFDSTSKFFSNKWGVPLEAYLESMEESLNSQTGVPAWFYIENNNEVIGGLGIIENDFHKRKDLTPNICALYVKEEYQGNGFSRELINKACSHLKEHNINDVYLITTHTKYYEKVGFSYYGNIEEDSGEMVRCYFKMLKLNK